MSNHEPSMHKSFSLRGEWWIDGIEGEKIVGKLSYNPRNGYKLKLNGIFSVELALPREQRHNSFSKICGNAFNNTICVIDKAWILKKKPSRIEAGNISVYGAYSADFGGLGLFSTTPHRYSNASIKLSGLTDLIARGLPEINPSESQWPTQPTIEFKIPAIDCTIRILGGAVSEFHGLKEQGYTYDETFTIIPQTPRSKKWYQDIAYRLNCLVTILRGTPSTIESLSLSPNETLEFEEIADSGLHRCTSVESVYITGRTRIKPNKLTEHSHHSFKSLGVHAESLFAGWLTLDILEQRCSGILYGSLISRETPVDLQLVALVTAIEQIASATGVSRPITSSSFKLISNRLENQIPKCLNDYIFKLLKDRIKNSNGKTLRDSIDALLEMLHPIASRILTFENDDFSADVTRTRNSIAHPRSEAELDRSKNISKMVLLVDSLEYLLKHHLLIRAGLPETVLIKNYQENFELRNIFSLRILQSKSET